jgi:hypothetical protein
VDVATDTDAHNGSTVESQVVTMRLQRVDEEAGSDEKTNGAKAPRTAR